MTKQGKIRESLARSAYYFENRGKECIVWGILVDEYKAPFYQFADMALSDEASQGVVIKVEEDTTDFIKCPCDDCTAEIKLIDEWGYLCDLACGQRSHWISRCTGANEARKAGFVATEPLLEVKDGS